MNFEWKPFSNYEDFVMLLRRNSQAWLDALHHQKLMGYVHFFCKKISYGFQYFLQNKHIDFREL